MKLKSYLWLLITCEALILLPIFPGLAEEDPAVTAGVEWLRGAAGPDGGFGAVVDARGSGLAAAALGAHGHDVTDAVSSLASISPANAEKASFLLLAAPEPTNAAHLLSLQLPDGSYGSGILGAYLSRLCLRAEMCL